MRFPSVSRVWRVNYQIIWSSVIAPVRSKVDVEMKIYLLGTAKSLIKLFLYSPKCELPQGQKRNISLFSARQGQFPNSRRSCERCDGWYVCFCVDAARSPLVASPRAPRCLPRWFAPKLILKRWLHKIFMCVAESERASGVFHSGAATSSLSLWLALVFYRLAREISEEISGWLCVCPQWLLSPRSLSLSPAYPPWQSLGLGKGRRIISPWARSHQDGGAWRRRRIGARGADRDSSHSTWSCKHRVHCCSEALFSNDPSTGLLSRRAVHACTPSGTKRVCVCECESAEEKKTSPRRVESSEEELHPIASGFEDAPAV